MFRKFISKVSHLVALLFILLCCNELLLGRYSLISNILAMNGIRPRYPMPNNFNVYTSSVRQSEKAVSHNNPNSNSNNNNNNIQTMTKSTGLKAPSMVTTMKINEPQIELISSSKAYSLNASNSIDRNFKFTNHPVGGYGLVSSAQNHINLESLSQTTKSPLITVDKNSPTIITNSLIKPSSDSRKRSQKDNEKSEWPSSMASEEYSKINMRIMGQPIDPSVVNHLHPDVSPHKAKKLRKILSGSLDKDWTSETPPRVLRQRGLSGSVMSNDNANKNNIDENYSSLDTKLLKEIKELNFTFRNSYGVYFTLSEEQIQPYRYWLLERATCEMDFIWEDLGPLFWPRWIRRGVCLNRPGHSCSWPSGMKCRPSGSRALQLLHWKCEDAAQVQSREHAADQRIRRRVAMNTFHSGFYEMEPVSETVTNKQKRDTTYARLSLRDSGLQQQQQAERQRQYQHSEQNAYRKLQARNLVKNSWTRSIKSSELLLSSPSSSSSLSLSSSPTTLHSDINAKDEKRRRRARRLIKRLSVTANGYHCYWQVQKYLISDRCSCSCS
ncbi:unnamed protein product [Trichobilharzia szidati]|nr:unnamed protein product [Trichobilharzia szidati]